MLNIKSLFNCALLSVLCLGGAELLHQNQISAWQEIPSFDEQAIDCASHHGKKSKKCKTLTLSDFAGQFIFASDSLGGLGAAVSPVIPPASPTHTVGRSSSTDGVVSIDKNGNITFHFYSTSIYYGVPGTLISPTIIPSSITGKISITDPEFGFGTITLTDSALGTTASVDFVTVIDKNDCKVLKVEGHITTAEPLTANVQTFTLERRFQ